MGPRQDRLVGIKQAEQRLGRERKAIYRLVRERELRSRKVHGRHMFSDAELDRFIEGRAQEQP